MLGSSNWSLKFDRLRGRYGMKNILVFPCGSEIGLEIHRSMKYSTHFRLIGGSSVDDHGRFVFDDYVDGIPFHNAPGFLERIGEIVEEHRIDAIYPTMDAVARTLKRNEELIGCRVIGSPVETTSACASKKETYAKLDGVVPVPRTYASLSEVTDFPVFIKPDVGYGSRNVCLAKDRSAAEVYLGSLGEGESVICEYLPGVEFTVDCFSDRKGELLFVGARERHRISNGISVNTRNSPKFPELFPVCARRINEAMTPRGAWFFQMKLDRNGEPKLLEVAARLGGSSSLFRSQGVNFALLTAFDAFDINVSITKNDYGSELDRALHNRYRLGLEYSTVYVDYDDCVLLGDKVNHEMVGYLFQSINRGKKVVLITRHAGDLEGSLRRYRLAGLFDEVIHLRQGEPKSRYIDPASSIFIDDSHAERAEVKRIHGIAVFSPDMVETLLLGA